MVAIWLPKKEQGRRVLASYELFIRYIKSLLMKLRSLVINFVANFIKKLIFSFSFFSGLVSKVVPAEKLIEEAVKLGEKISARNPPLLWSSARNLSTLPTKLPSSMVSSWRSATFATVICIIFLIFISF
jgi:hypothetical protein